MALLENILKKDGLSLKKLEKLSYRSKLGIRLKKNLHYFDKDVLFKELDGFTNTYISVIMIMRLDVN